MQTEGIGAQVYNDFEQLRAVQPEWDEFVESAGCEIFLSYDWCRIWWQYYGDGRELSVYVFRDDGRIVGIMPLFFENMRFGPIVVRTVKIVGTDFILSQFSLAVKQEYIEPVLQALSASMSQKKWDIFYLGPVAGAYKDCDRVIDAITRHFPDANCKEAGRQFEQTYFDVNGDWDGYLSGLSKKERQKIRKNYKAIAESPMPLEISLAQKDDVADYFNEFVAMHGSRWNKSGKSGHFGDWPDAEKFHKQLAETNLGLGRLRLLKFRIGDKCLGYKYYYKFGDRYYLFLDARQAGDDDGISWGRIMFCEVIKRAVDEKVRLLDSMRGRYEHKLHLGGKLFTMRALYIVPKNASSAVKMLLMRVFAYVINICYYKIWYCRIAPACSAVSRPLWKVWIRTNAFS